MTKLQHYYKIQRISDNRYLYKIKSNCSADSVMFRITYHTCFTDKLCNAEIFEKRSDANKAIKRCVKCDNSCLEDYYVLEYSLSERNINDYILNSKKGEFLFKVRNKLNKRFVKESIVFEYSSKLIYGKVKGKIFKKHSIASNFLFYNISSVWNGYKHSHIKGGKMVENIKNNFEIVAFSLDKILRRKILIEKIKRRKK